jgi:hypothetical protein
MGEARRARLPATRYPLPVTRYPLPVARCPLPVTRYPLPVVCCPLPGVHWRVSLGLGPHKKTLLASAAFFYSRPLILGRAPSGGRDG